MSINVANTATGVNIYDAIALNNPIIDLSANVGTGDISLNSALQQYVMFQNNVTVPTAISGNGFSFSGWFYPTVSQVIGSTILDISGTGGIKCTLYYGTNNTLSGYFNGVSLNSSITINPGSWHFFTYTIACTSQGNASQSLYVDNNSPIIDNNATYTSFSIGSQYTSTAAYIGIGNTNGLTPTLSCFNGKIDDFRFYSRVLTSPEINVLYNFNTKSNNTTPSIFAQCSYDVPYYNAIQIIVSGTFSGLYITRVLPATGETMTTQISASSLTLVNDIAWAYVDASVNYNTTYTYSLTPYVQNNSGTTVNLSTITPNSLINGSFKEGTNLPALGKYSTVTSSNLSGWTVTSTQPDNTSVWLCNGSISGISFTNALPSTFNYYVNIRQSIKGASTRIQQLFGFYAGSQYYLSFYAWPNDGLYNSSQTLTVMFDCTVLLNNYSFSSPYNIAAFTFPVSVSKTGKCALTFTITSTSSNTTTGINIGNIQLLAQSLTNIGNKVVDPSGLVLYYPLDSNSTSGTLVYNCSTGILPGIADASLCSGAIMSSTPVPSLLSKTTTSFNGLTSYICLPSWTMPSKSIGSSFSISGWFYPLSGTSSNSLICWLGTGGTSGDVKVFLNQGALDFSMGYVEVLSTTSASYNYTANAWNFFALTGQCGSDLSGTYTFYLNSLPLTSIKQLWLSNTNFLNNYLGGYPSGVSSGSLGYLLGSIQDFRIYNRSLSAQEISSLWSYGLSNTSYTSIVDPTTLGIYYPMDQSTRIVGSGNVNPPTYSNITTSGLTLTCTGNFFKVNVTYTGGIGTPATNFAINGTGIVTQAMTGLSANTLYTFTTYVMNDSTILFPLSATSSVMTLGTVNTPVISNLTATGLRLDCSGSFSSCKVTYSGGTANQASGTIISGANSASITFTGLSPNTSYTFVVYPMNTNNVQSTIGSTISVVTLGSIGSLRASNTTINGTNLDCSGVFTSCNLSFTGGTASITSPFTFNTVNAFSQILTSMTSNSTYTFTAYAINSAGVVSTSGTQLVVNTLAVISSTPTVNATTSSSTTLVCNGLFSKCNVVYNGNRSTLVTPSSGSLLTGLNTITQVYSSMTANSLYTFFVFPVNIVGIQSTTSTTVNVLTLGEITTALTQFNITSSSIGISCNGSFNSCMVNVTGGPSVPASGSIINGNNSIMTNYTYLNPNTNYTFTVYPINSGGLASSVGTTGTFVTLSRLNSLTMSNITAFGATVSSYGSFSVCVFNNTQTSLTNSVTGANSATYTYSGLSPNTTYNISVYSLNLMGVVSTGVTDISSITFLTLGSANTPTFNSISSTGMTILCSGSFSSCYIMYSGGSALPESGFVVTGTNSISQVMTNMNPNTNYTFYVYPRNSNDIQNVLYSTASVTTTT